MKKYVALLLQTFIWSGFTLIQWLSGKDHLLSKTILFIVFFYLAITIVKTIVQSNKITFLITIFSLFLYGVTHFTLHLIGKII